MSNTATLEHICSDKLETLRIVHTPAGWVLRVRGPGVPRVSLVVRYCPWCGLDLDE